MERAVADDVLFRAVFFEATTIAERTIYASDAVVPTRGAVVLAPGATGANITSTPFLVVQGRFIINGTLRVDLSSFTVATRYMIRGVAICL